MGCDRVAINRYLDMYGVKHAKLGYLYLVCIIQLGVEEQSNLRSIKKLYERVAELNDTKSFQVERSIRYAILHLETTNKEFIYKAVDEFAWSRNVASTGTDDLISAAI